MLLPPLGPQFVKLFALAQAKRVQYFKQKAPQNNQNGVPVSLISVIPTALSRGTITADPPHTNARSKIVFLLAAGKLLENGRSFLFVYSAENIGKVN